MARAFLAINIRRDHFRFVLLCLFGIGTRIASWVPAKIEGLVWIIGVFAAKSRNMSSMKVDEDENSDCNGDYNGEGDG